MSSTAPFFTPAPDGVSADLYRDVTDLAAASPHWLQVAAEVGTEAGLALYALLFLLCWWRSRHGGAGGVGVALLAPVATLAAYAVSEGTKLLVREDRPCRGLPGVDPLAACPGVGDWSLPSNHAAIAGATVVTVGWAWRRLLLAAVPLAAALAFSRVFVGVHYPHDVLAGLLLGAVVAPAVVAALARPGSRLVRRLRSHPLLRPALASGRRPAR